MKTIGWNVDTQYDFMRADGKLPVPDAQSIEPVLANLTALFKETNTQVVNTADWHNENTEEISETPDFATTFPEHCMENTEGAMYVPATTPEDTENTYVIGWNDLGFDPKGVERRRNIILRKDKFDAFAGNPHTADVLKETGATHAVVYGVATNFCVRYAVEGLLNNGIEVTLVTDAIKALPDDLLEPKDKTDYLMSKWEDAGVRFAKSTEIADYLR